MVVKNPTVLLNNGYEMPLIGFGTANAYEDEIIRAVEDAVDVGYRHIDGAFFYANEVEVGKAIRQKMEEKVVERKDLFIVSKLWCSFMSPDLVQPALCRTLSDLQLDYLDLYLMHWPMAFEENSELIPLDENGLLKCKEVDYLDTWKAMEACVRQGLVRSIGVSNFNSQQIKRLVDNCTIKPVNNQIEVHPYLTQKPLINLCREYNITVTAYGPIGRPGLSQDPTNDPVLMDDEKIKEVAVKYGRTVPQIILRYLTMQGLAVIPKSSSRVRIIENFNSIDFDLAVEDVALIDGLNRDCRLLKNTWASHHPHYPFHLPY